MKERISVPDVMNARDPLVMVTAYDAFSAEVAKRAAVDIILVGDSVGMVIQGQENTLNVTLEDIIYHAKAVNRSQPSALVVGDLPYLSYHISPSETIRNAGRLIQESGVDAVKLEGGQVRIPMVKALVSAEIPVMGHLGLTPQSVNRFGGFRVQAKSEQARNQLKLDALALQDAGVFAVVLECIPSDLAAEVTEILDIPTIGIGAGPDCRGQVLVFHDLLGMGYGHRPKFVRQYANFGEIAQQAVSAFVLDVKTKDFPATEESYRPRREKLTTVRAID